MKSNKYKRLTSIVYDITRPPNRSIDGDVEFYLKELLPKSCLVLEAGVGNGGMTIPFLRKKY